MTLDQFDKGNSTAILEGFFCPSIPSESRFSQVPMTIIEGKLAPLFTLRNQEGEKVALKQLRGQKVVVYFYPQDDTPG